MEPLSDRNFSEIHISVPWGTITGRWYGDQTVRPILALHGIMDNCGTFARLAPLLLTQASLLCIDLPGHGYSSHFPAGALYFNADFIRVILCIMKTYKWSKVSLLGHSMGAAIIFDFAAIFPNRVDILINIDALNRQYFEHEQHIKEINKCFEGALMDNERLIAKSRFDEPSSYTYEVCEKRLYDGLQQSVAFENCKYILERNIVKSQKYPNRYYMTRDGRLKWITSWNPSKPLRKYLALRLSRQSIPHLVIKGGASTMLDSSSQIIDILKKRNPCFEMHEVPGGTHHVHLNNAENVAAHMLKFLQKYRPLEKVQLEDSDKAKL